MTGIRLATKGIIGRPGEAEEEVIVYAEIEIGISVEQRQVVQVDEVAPMIVVNQPRRNIGVATDGQSISVVAQNEARIQVEAS